jgi:hypothetical protein
LTLRTPTLDDVFLELTGNHIVNPGSHGAEAVDAMTPELAEVGQ